MDLRALLTTHVKLRHLVIVLTVAEQGSLVRAAEELYLTQPALSRALREAEHAIGAPLFERTARGMVPTLAGEACLEHAKAIVGHLSTLRRRVDELADPASGLVKVGAHVTVLSRSRDKETDALELGAEALLVSADEAAMQAAANSFDLIIDTVPVKHDIMPYLPLLDIDGSLVLVGQLGPVEPIDTMPFLLGRRRVSGSPIGGIRETQELLDFAAEKNILPEVEMIAIQDINQAFERMEKADVRYRFVIDMASLERPA